jgi:hypothetical protein
VGTARPAGDPQDCDVSGKCPAPRGTSLRFAGRQVVDFGDIDALDGVRSYSIQAWVKFASLSVYSTVFAKRLGDGDRATVLQYSYVPGSLGISVDGGYTVSEGPVVTTGAWYHMVVVYEASQGDADRLQLYVNGERRATKTILGTVPKATSKSPSRFTIGAEYNGTPPITTGSPLMVPLSGKVDEAALWSKALAATEIAALYNGGAPTDALRDAGGYNSSRSLVSYWRFDEGSGTKIGDAKGAHPGTIVNAAAFSSDVP